MLTLPLWVLLAGQTGSGSMTPVSALFAGVSRDSAPLRTDSRYLSWLSGDTAADSTRAYELACRSAQTSSGGPVLLAVGRQVTGGTSGFSNPLTPRSYAHLSEVFHAYSRGLSECSSSLWILAPTTSNHRLDGLVDPYSAGRQWQEMLRSLPKVPRVFYMGGIDLEPAWSSPEAAGKWVQGYREAGSVPLLSNASADGCPYDASRRSCSNGWNIGMLAEMVWGGPGWAVIPQIYRHDGVMAEQWGQIAREWHARGKRPLFVGVMTQFRACQQVRNSNCPQLSLAPENAVEQMRRALGEIARVPSVTDVGWG